MAKRGESGRKRRLRSGGKGGGERKYRIFVSHATVDKWVAKVICERLDAAGVTTFRDDRDIDGGDKIPERIRINPTVPGVRASHAAILQPSLGVD